jgi:hypothetical protein
VDGVVEGPVADGEDSTEAATAYPGGLPPFPKGALSCTFQADDMPA